MLSLVYIILILMEFGFATAPLVAMGCMMQRDCQQDTCPVGVATQNCKLRSCFAGKPEYVVNFMMFVAEEMREIMAQLGFRTVDEMVGHPEYLRQVEVSGNWKANEMDLSDMLATVTNEFGQAIPGAEGKHFLPSMAPDCQLDRALDATLFIPYTAEAREHLHPIRFRADIANVNRCVGTMLGSQVTRQHPEGLPEGSITVDCDGSGGQSFGAFLPRGITLNIEGDANDYFGKGLSGGVLTVRPPEAATYKFDENVVVGNVAFYGATSGTAFINGVAGERFCVRNSGATAVVEGVGDHGCEYMTGGRVVILGKTGKNFAAGMSGGIAYVLDEDNDLYMRTNKQMVFTEEVSNKYDVLELKEMIKEHVTLTNSEKGKEILDHFSEYLPKFKKVIPYDYNRMQMAIVQMEEKGLNAEQAQIEAFYASTRG